MDFDQMKSEQEATQREAAVGDEDQSAFERASIDRQRVSMRANRRQATMAEDRTVPHLTNLNEDPQMSGLVFYSLISGTIHIGRRSGDPVPEIILGSIGIKPNHAKVSLTDKGLFELSVCDAEAAATTYVNGKPLPKKLKKELNHLDRIAFAGGIIYVFIYPLLNEKIKELVAKNEGENADLNEEQRREQAWVEIKDAGIAGFTDVKCPKYADVEKDRNAIEWEHAFMEIEKAEEDRKKKELKDQQREHKKEQQKQEAMIREIREQEQKRVDEERRKYEEEMARLAE